MTQLLYAAKGGSATTSDLYTIDPSTGAATSIGAIGFALTGLAFDPTDSTLYGATSVTSAASPKSLISIDAVTGAGTLIGGFAGHAIPDIAFDSTGQLYGWRKDNEQLVLINKASGALTATGASGLGSSNGDGLSFNLADVAYEFPDGTGGNLYTVNTSTGVATNTGTGLNDVGLTHRNNPVGAAAFDVSDVLWGLEPNHGILFTVNVGSGVLTQQATLPAPGGFVVWDAIAWDIPAGGDVTPPTLVSVDAVAATVTLTYDEPLAGTPLTSEFAVTRNGVADTVTAASIDGSTVLLALTTPVRVGETVLVSYTA